MLALQSRPHWIMIPSFDLLEIFRWRTRSTGTIFIAQIRAPSPQVFALRCQLITSAMHDVDSSLSRQGKEQQKKVDDIGQKAGQVARSLTLPSIRSATCLPTTGNILNV